MAEDRLCGIVTRDMPGEAWVLDPVDMVLEDILKLYIKGFLAAVGVVMWGVVAERIRASDSSSGG